MGNKKIKDLRTDAEKVLDKIAAGKKLNKDDIGFVREVLEDPLQEFCKRESKFRLCSFFNRGEEADEVLVDEVTDIIRDTIDSSANLYREVDSNIQDFLNEYKK